jgi:hypothetical protein
MSNGAAPLAPAKDSKTSSRTRQRFEGFASA